MLPDGWNYRPAIGDDANLVASYRNKYRNCFFRNQLVTEEETRAWIESENKKVDSFIFIITHSWNTKGQCGVQNIVLNETASFGRIIRYGGDKYYFGCVCDEIMRNISSLFNLKLLFAEVKIWNKWSLNFFAKRGFKVIERRGSGEDDHFLLCRGMK